MRDAGLARRGRGPEKEETSPTSVKKGQFQQVKSDFKPHLHHELKTQTESQANLCDFGLCKDFLAMTPKTQPIK